MLRAARSVERNDATPRPGVVVGRLSIASNLHWTMPEGHASGSRKLRGLCAMRALPAKDRTMHFPTRLVAVAVLIAAVSLLPHPARAADKAKVEQLLVVLKADRQIEQIKGILEKSMEQGIVAGAKRKGITQAELDRGRPIIMAALTKAIEEAFSWDYFKPRLVGVYEEELSNEEVDAALAYYGSPLGQTMLAKMPALMQRGADIGVARAREMEPKMDAIMDQAMRQIREDETRDAKTNVDAAVKQVHDDATKNADMTNPPPAEDKK
jgi:uncharacterized protein